MALIPKFFQDSIVAIGLPKLDSNVAWIGTGFLYGKHRPEDNKYNIYLVTNKHVFADHKVVTVRFDSSSGGTLPIEVDLSPKGTKLWTGHPDPSIDVAVLPINPQFLKDNGAHFNFFHSNLNALPLKDPLASDLAEGDGIFILGFPMGLVDVQANIAITRMGSIARIRDCLAGRSKSFLVDAPVYPGNSGGPVILRPEGLAITGTKSILTAYLLGIVNSYIPFLDTAVSLQTGRNRIIFEENSGLSNVFPVDYIDEAILEVEKAGKVIKADAASNPV